MAIKTYIAGPMSGLDNENRAAFNQLAQTLKQQGHVILNPAILPDGLEQHEYMDICFAMVRAADQLIMLKGWGNSEGATAEYYYAVKLKKTILYQNDLELKLDNAL